MPPHSRNSSAHNYPEKQQNLRTGTTPEEHTNESITVGERLQNTLMKKGS